MKNIIPCLLLTENGLYASSLIGVWRLNKLSLQIGAKKQKVNQRGCRRAILLPFTNINQLKQNQMTTTNLEIKKLQRVENTDKELLEKGIAAFQLVEIGYSIYGQSMADVLDTKIMANGDQIIIDGNGFIKAGFILPA